ncbi:MAG: flagellar assembly protein FliW [Helicobacteraceae bacterium]|nr:flagellar assembly protein FliW [Helicobacteraceae bacterium]
MIFNVESTILGFENIKQLELNKIDELFLTVQDVQNREIAFTLVNPYLMREYEFELSAALKVLLDINENSDINVYNIAVVKDPLDESCINFLAPLIFNRDNGKVAQVILEAKNYPYFGFAEPLKNHRLTIAA